MIELAAPSSILRAALPVCAGVWLVACAQVLGVDDYTNAPKGAATGGGGGAPPSLTACDLPYPSTGCASCVTAHCCDESASCATDQACAAHARCLAGCGGDPGCRAQCALDGPVSRSKDASAFSACLASQCEEACGLSCGLALGDYGEYPPPVASACHDCIVANACAAAQACAASDDCDALKRCYASCYTTDCRLACYGAHAAGRSLALSLSSETGMCDTACARGSNWSCVGNVSWPNPKSDTTMFTVEFLGYAGTEVTVCDRADFGCMYPKVQGKTKDDGVGVFEVQNPPNRTFPGVDGFLRLFHPEASGRMFVYWGFPLSEPEMALADSSDLYEARAVRLGNHMQAENAFKLWGVTPDPSLGGVIATAVDCMGAPAPGVVLTLDPLDSKVVIIHSFVPGPGQPATNREVPTAFMFNVPPGLVTVVATPQALDGQPSSKQRIVVRADAVSSVLMLPTPP